jgi:hypothetical protein
MRKAKFTRGSRLAPARVKVPAGKYKMLLGYDVPFYGMIEFTAQSDASAARKARRMLDDWDRYLGDVVFAAEHGGADQHRVVNVHNVATQETIAEDLHLYTPPCPKVLIHVHKGVAEYCISGGSVDVVLVDEDNIDAGDPPVDLDESWRELTKDCFSEVESKYVRYVTRK